MANVRLAPQTVSATLAESGVMTILLISTDLMIQSRVAAAATQQGLAPPKIGGSVAAAPLDAPADCGIVILDLSTSGLDVAAAVRSLRDRLPQSTSIVAFAPHVHTAKLAAAHDAGCDQVLSRGQFDREIDAVIERRLATCDDAN
jgi:DNA-binding NarL/FixJ family response regulator